MITMRKERLIAYRVDAGFETQQELANAAGVALTTVNYGETGKRALTWKSKRKIVNALRARGMEVTIEDIDWSLTPK